MISWTYDRIGQGIKAFYWKLQIWLNPYCTWIFHEWSSTKCMFLCGSKIKYSRYVYDLKKLVRFIWIWYSEYHGTNFTRGPCLGKYCKKLELSGTMSTSKRHLFSLLHNVHIIFFRYESQLLSFNIKFYTKIKVCSQK